MKHIDEALAAREIDPLCSAVISHVIDIITCRKCEQLLAGIAVYNREASRLATRDQQPMFRFEQHQGCVVLNELQWPHRFEFSSAAIKDRNLVLVPGIHIQQWTALLERDRL